MLIISGLHSALDFESASRRVIVADRIRWETLKGVKLTLIVISVAFAPVEEPWITSISCTVACRAGLWSVVLSLSPMEYVILNIVESLVLGEKENTSAVFYGGWGGFVLDACARHTWYDLLKWLAYQEPSKYVLAFDRLPQPNSGPLILNAHWHQLANGTLYFLLDASLLRAQVGLGNGGFWCSALVLS